MQRHLSQQLSVILLCQLLRPAGAKDWLVMTAVAANMHTHILNNTQHRYFDFFEHHNAFFGID